MHKKINNSVPTKGDIIFFKNTEDRNKDGGMTNYGITHAGIVVEVSTSDGTVIFAHALGKNHGVLIGSKLNLDLTDDEHNLVLRYSPKANAAELFSGFGTIRNIEPPKK